MFDDRLSLEFDIDAIPALSERRKRIYENVTSAVAQGIMSRNEARAAIGLEPKKGADDLLVPATYSLLETSPSQSQRIQSKNKTLKTTCQTMRKM